MVVRVRGVRVESHRVVGEVVLGMGCQGEDAEERAA